MCARRFGDYGPSISMADSRAPEMLAEEDLACCACDACPRTAHVLCFCSGPRGRRWAFQTALYLLIVLVEKLITALFLMLPFWSAVNRVLMLIIPIPSLRVVFVLLIIPLVVNVLTYLIYYIKLHYCTAHKNILDALNNMAIFDKRCSKKNAEFE